MRVLLTAFLALALSSGSAFAGNVAWYLDSITFDDGGTASGSFVYNADTNTYSSIDIDTTLGGSRGAAHYGFVAPGFPAAPDGLIFDTISAGDLSGTPGFALFFTPGLTNAGGTVSIGGSQEATCGDSGCSFPVGPQRLVNGGNVTSTAPEELVPEPASMLMLGLGVALIGFTKSRVRAG